jgi:pimeloyl-ACP methyl ester carboxylesterase
MVSLSYPLAKMRWFSKLQAKQMYIPSTMFEHYFTDSSKMTKQSLLHLSLSNERYALPKEFVNTRADVLAMCGNKEYTIMKKSTIAIHQTALKGHLLIVPDCGHGISIKSPDNYIKIIKEFFAR